MSGYGLTRVPLLMAVLALLAGCAAGPHVDDQVAAGEAVPTDLEQRFSLALGHLQAGDLAVAGPELESLVADYPEYAGPLFNLGLVRVAEDRDADAEQLFLRATAVCSRCAPPWNELGIVYRRSGRFAEAEEAYLQALAFEPDYANAYFNLALLYELYAGRPALALEAYERYLALEPDGQASGAVQAWVAELRRRTQSAPTAARAEGET